MARKVVSVGFVLCDSSSMEWWLHALYCDRKPSAHSLDALKATRACSKDINAFVQAFPWLSTPLHILVESPTAKRRGAKFVSHTKPHGMSEDSLCRITRSDFASSPALTAIQMSRNSTLPETARFVSMLCAQFVFSKDNKSLFKRQPIVTKEIISDFSWENPGIYGSKSLEEALPYAFDNAASPPEIDLALRLSLPRRFGGYGLTPPSLNTVIPLNENARSVARRHYVVGDLCWIPDKLVVEYDSDLEHLNSLQAERDATKRLALNMLGYEVITVTTLMMKSPEAFEGVAKRVSKHLGASLRIRDSKFKARQERLFSLSRSIPWKRETEALMR